MFLSATVVVSRIRFRIMVGEPPHRVDWHPVTVVHWRIIWHAVEGIVVIVAVPVPWIPPGNPMVKWKIEPKHQMVIRRV
jgi:hypothetical protein